MGDHLSDSRDHGATTTTDEELGTSFWESALQGVAQRLVDPRIPGKPADPTALLPWVDDDHHAAPMSDPRFWGDELRQEEFQRRRKRDELMESRRSQHASELHGIPAAYRIEEQVVGSTHRFVVARPRITNDLTALVTPSIRAAKGGEAHGLTTRAPTATGMYVLSKENESEIAIQFEPQQAGPVSAEIELEIRWTDGSVDVRTIALHASARLRTEIPESEVPVSPADQYREAAEFGVPIASDATAPSPAQTVAATNEFHQLVSDVRQAANTLVDRQIDGVDTARDEARSFKREPPETSLLFDLMELAVSMGVAGVAGIIAKNLGKALAARLGKDDKSAVAVGVGDALKEGMKRIGNSATVKQNTVEKLPGGPEKRPADESLQLDEDELAHRPASSNSRIAFFAEQTAMLRDLVDDHQALIAEQSRKLMPLLQSDPEQALATMRALKQAFEEARDARARDIQADASAYQWVAAVARSSLGATVASTHDRSYSRKVSDLVKYGDMTEGVLSIQVERSGEDLNVTSANIRGVSQELADRLAERPLMDAPIPIRIRVTSGAATAVIHLDEAKRMRVYGLIEPSDAPAISEYVQQQNMPEQFEAQSTARAERIVSSVLAHPLPIDKISSDDASGRSDP